MTASPVYLACTAIRELKIKETSHTCDWFPKHNDYGATMLALWISSENSADSRRHGEEACSLSLMPDEWLVSPT